MKLNVNLKTQFFNQNSPAHHLPKLEDHSKSFGAMVERSINRFNGMVLRNKGRAMVGWLMANITPLLGEISGSKVKLTCHFAFHCYRIGRNEGFRGLVIHLKASHVLIQQAIGGYVIKDMGPLKRRVRRSRPGLPKWIPVQERRRLMSGDVASIRYWTSMVALYRVLSFEGKLDTSTITDPGKPIILEGILAQSFSYVLRWLWDQDFGSLTYWQDRWKKVKFKPVPWGTASPTTSVRLDPTTGETGFISSSAYSVIRSARYWISKTGAPAFKALTLFLGYREDGSFEHPDGETFIERLYALATFGGYVKVQELDYGKIFSYSTVNRPKVPTWKLYLRESVWFKRLFEYIFKQPWAPVDEEIRPSGPHVEQLKPSIAKVYSPVGNTPYEKAFEQVSSSTTRRESLRHEGFVPSTRRVFDSDIRPIISLGKLGMKDEPAGKIRVFAMVDPWTQWVLRPLHLLLFDLLRRIPTDATFDQVGVLERVQERVMKAGYRVAKAYSFDLSAATDRLPVRLQEKILEPLLGKWSAVGWRRLLVDREYTLKTKDSQLLKLRYATGQPMGALSSWAMLAITHHVIVQWSWYLVCHSKGWPKKWTNDYVVLGDDIVIFNPFLAEKYYYIMTKLLGVKIGLAKSLQAKSRYVLEFAKKYWVDGKRAFMLPIRDILVATLSTAVLSEFIHKNEVTFQHYLKIRGLGYRSRAKVTGNLWNLSTRLRVYLVLWNQSSMPWWDWIRLKDGVGTLYPLSSEALGSLAEAVWTVRQRGPKSLLDKASVAYSWLLPSLSGLYKLYGAGIDYLRDDTIPCDHDLYEAKIAEVAKIPQGEPLLPGVRQSFGPDGKWLGRHPSVTSDFLAMLDVVVPLKPGELPRKAGDPHRFSSVRDPRLSRSDLILIIEKMLKEHETWQDKLGNWVSQLGWATQRRGEERRYTLFISLYKEWVLYNTCFVKAEQTVRNYIRLRKASLTYTLPEGSSGREDQPLYSSSVRRTFCPISFKGSWRADRTYSSFLLRRAIIFMSALTVGWAIGCAGLLLNSWLTSPLPFDAVKYHWVDWDLPKLQSIRADFDQFGYTVPEVDFVPLDTLLSPLWTEDFGGSALAESPLPEAWLVGGVILVLGVLSLAWLGEVLSNWGAVMPYPMNSDIGVIEQANRLFEPSLSSYPLYNHFAVGCRYTSVQHWEGYTRFYDASQNITSFVWRTYEPWERIPAYAYDVFPDTWYYITVNDMLGGFNWVPASWNFPLPTVVHLSRLLELGDQVWPVLSRVLS